jgi:hypothetical protein
MFAAGTPVLVPAQVVQIYHPDREPCHQSYGLQLGDGQHVMTNAGNVLPVPEPQPALEPVAVSLPCAACAERDEKARQLAEAKAKKAAQDKARRPVANKAISGPPAIGSRPSAK